MIAKVRPAVRLRPPPALDPPYEDEAAPEPWSMQLTLQLDGGSRRRRPSSLALPPVPVTPRPGLSAPATAADLAVSMVAAGLLTPAAPSGGSPARTASGAATGAVITPGAVAGTTVTPGGVAGDDRPGVVAGTAGVVASCDAAAVAAGGSARRVAGGSARRAAGGGAGMNAAVLAGAGAAVVAGSAGATVAGGGTAVAGGTGVSVAADGAGIGVAAGEAGTDVSASGPGAGVVAGEAGTGVAVGGPMRAGRAGRASASGTVTGPSGAVGAGAIAAASPEAKRAAKRFLDMCLEIFNGYRPAGHVRPLAGQLNAELIIEQIVAGLDRAERFRRMREPVRPNRRPGIFVQLRRLRVCEPRAGVAEAAAALGLADRTWALAFRLERRRGRWLCTAARLI
jgi:hypothetical protein